MATKAFYRAKSHIRPLADVYQRAVRALERGVPIGRGHPWQLPAAPGDSKRQFPDWKRHPWTQSVARALKASPPADPRRLRNRETIRELVIPYERYLDKFLKRHPEVTWKVPFNAFTDKEWAPVLFAKRWHELVEPKRVEGGDSVKGLSESEAYDKVVQEGGGGGDWHGVWESLNHNRLKNILFAETRFIQNPAEKRSNGISLLKAYQEAALADAKLGSKKTVWGANKTTGSKKVEKFFTERTTEATEKAFAKDMIDLGVLFKVRAIEAKRAAMNKVGSSQ